MPPQQQQPPQLPQPPQPSFPAPTPQPADNSSPYDFIMNHEPAKPVKPSKGGSKPLLFILAIVAVLIIVALVFVSLLSSGNKTAGPYVTIAQEQQEIARVADLQYASLTQQDTKNFTISTKLTMQADNATLLKYLSSDGVKIAPKELALGLNSATDKKFTDAVSVSNLDATVDKELQDELTTYKKSLGQAYASTQSPSARALLKKFNANADMLLTQSTQQQ